MSSMEEEECTCNKLNSFKSPWCDSDCFVVITGASRGFGQAFAVELVKSMSSGEDHAASLNVLLMARDVNGLRVTESKMYAALPNQSKMKLTILVSSSALDMSNANKENLTNELKPLVIELTKSQMVTSNSHGQKSQWNLLVHNAATLGNVNLKSNEYFHEETLTTYYHINLIAPILLTNLFLQHFMSANHHPRDINNHNQKQSITIVNISSLAAIQPLSYMSNYCVGKSAREMYFKCLSIDQPHLAIMNYSPGPLNTDMLQEIIDNHGDLQIRHRFAHQMKIIEPSESARVCIGWLRKQIPSCEQDVVGCGRQDDDDHAEMTPKLIHCTKHDKRFVNLWSGDHLDYFDAVEKV
ncbi:unnamed protein product [Schistosoma turkestanicum]|nr:unnamed protein product [Schistosoma turkestanicum]